MLTHFRNAVPLVWGSLRLAPITYVMGTRCCELSEPQLRFFVVNGKPEIGVQDHYQTGRHESFSCF